MLILGVKVSGLSSEEATMVSSLIDLKNILAKEVMIPYSKVFKLHTHETLNVEKLRQIDIKNYSKIPVYYESTLVGKIVI